MIKNILIAVFALTSVAFAVVWVIPKVSFVDRMKKDDANKLFQEFLLLLNKSDLSVSEKNRATEIIEKLGKAGYFIAPTSEADAKFKLIIPSYAE